MANFDFVESATKGYKFVWDERVLIAQIAMLPLVIKILTFIGVTALGLDDNYLRQGLLLLPAYIVEAWLVMQILRFAILGERGDVTLSGNEDQDRRHIEARKRGIMSGMIIYVLIKLVAAFFSALVFMGGEMQQTVKPAEINDLHAFIVSVGFLLLVIWGFRFAWLYIPAAFDYPLKDFLRRIKPFMTSLSMIGVWFLSFVPIMLVLVIFAEFLSMVFPSPVEGEIVGLYKYSMVAVQGVLDMLIALVSSVGMAYGIQSIYDGTNKPTPI